MVKKKLAVCGCSFMTSSYNKYHLIKGSSWPEYADVEFLDDSDIIKKEIECTWQYEHWLHFVDLYIQSKNLEYINLAYGGASNFMIRLQIDQAIKFKSDYIIISATSTDRKDIPLRNFSYDKLIRNYDTTQTESHIAGVDNGILSNIGDKKNLIAWPGMAEDQNLTKNKKDAIKQYLTNLYDKDLYEIKSYYIIQSGLMKLEKAGIPYIFLPGPLKHLDWEGFSCCPADAPQPWDYVNSDLWSPAGNHLPSSIHRKMFETLSNITVNWNN